MIHNTSKTFLDHSFHVAGRLIDPVLGEVNYKKKVRPIRRKELEALALLAEQPGEVVSRDQFILEIWDNNHLTGDPGLSRLISYLRSTLDDKDSQSPIIRTVPRRGYQLNAEVQVGNVGHNRELMAGDSIGGFHDRHLVRLLSKNTTSESWLVQSGNEYKVYRFCLEEHHRNHLRRELKILSYLNVTFGDHPHICTINKWQLEEPPYYVEMPSTDCGDVEAWMKEYSNLSEISFNQRFEVINQIVEALVFIHSKGIVHQNISRSSVFIHKQSPQRFFAKLGEFGLSRITIQANHSAVNLTEPGYALTSTGFSSNNEYLAPEILTGAQQDSKSDIYAMGVLIYQILLGNYKFVPMTVETNEPLKILSIIKQCLNEEPEKRPSADQLLNVLMELSQSFEESSLKLELANQYLQQEQASEISLSVDNETYIGPYKIIALLGEGGMGSVYLGHQSEPVDRNVAIKIIKAGMKNKDMKSRFNQEIKSLAVLEHPNVAMVYEASVDKNGYPYMVMEYVPGVAITTYSDEKRLGINERVKLFIQVCDGVLHAHQKSIIHRDINPQNILVDKEKIEPEVKLIDFGVSKFYLSHNDQNTPNTHFGSFVGIPNYISPEQISGGAGKTDTRSDLYSLGVVLYELLIGRTPYTANELKELSQVDLINILRLKSPPKMKAVFEIADKDVQITTASLRLLKPNQLIKSVDGEISWIINKCLEPNINDRYESVLMLKQDLQNYLDNKPVMARKFSKWYGFEKFVKRNRAAVLFGLVVSLSLVLTTTLAVMGQIKAQKATSDAEMAASEAQMAAHFQSQQLQVINPNKMGLALRQTLFEELASVDNSHPEVKERLKKLLTEINFTNVAMTQLDENIFQPALRVIEDDYQDFPLLQATLRQSVADTLIELSLIDLAKEPLIKAYETRVSVLGPSHSDTNHSLAKRALLAFLSGEYENAESLAQLALTNAENNHGKISNAVLEPLNILADIATQIVDSDAANNYDRRILAIIDVLNDNSHHLKIKAINRTGLRNIVTGQYVEAIALYEGLIKGIDQPEVAANPGIWEVMYSLVIAYHYNNQTEKAEILSKSLLELRQKHFGSAHKTTLKSLDLYAIVLIQRGKLEDALKQYQKYLKISSETYGEDNADVIRIKPNYAYLLVRSGKLIEAKQVYESVIDSNIKKFGLNHYRSINILDSLGSIYFNLGQNNQAKEYYQKALFEDGKEVEFNDPTHYIFLYNYSEYLVENGSVQEAKNLINMKLTKQIKLLGASNQHVAGGKLALGWIYQNLKQYEKAGALYDEAEQEFIKINDVNNADLIKIYYYRSLMQRELGNHQNALTMSEKLVESSASLYPNTHYKRSVYLQELAINQLAAKMIDEALITMESAWDLNVKSGANGAKHREKIGQDLINIYLRNDVNLPPEDVENKIKLIKSYF